MGITEQDIQQYLSGIYGNVEDNVSIWAVKMPSVFNMVVYGPMANLFDLRYNIMNISRDRIIIIGVDNAGRLTPLHVCINKNEIQRIKIKSKFLGSQVEIITENGSLVYTVNKVMIGSSFHKVNYGNAISLLEQYNGN